MRALLSVYDKTGIDAFARGLIELGFELISTGGTLKHLQGLELPVKSVSDVTGFPEILDGRVKTLHPAIHGGILARVDLPDHMDALQRHGITAIDLVAVNLYPFEKTVSDPTCSLTDALEQIDIGGPAMVRASAKNFPSTVILTDPGDYDLVLDALRSGGVGDAGRRELAAKAFQHVSTYDALVAEYLRDGDDLFPDELTVPARRTHLLRYGENPHQSAAAYRVPTTGASTAGVLDAVQLHGKELSYNNLLDANAAFAAVIGLDQPASCVVKHTIPCGLAVGPSIVEAYRGAFAGDPVSAFGGIVALNRDVDEAAATALSEVFYEVIIAPGYSDQARTLLLAKKNLRLLQLDARAWARSKRQDVRSVIGGLLVQQSDSEVDPETEWTYPTAASIEPTLLDDLRLAWHAARFVKSNAIVLVKDGAVVGVGPGQPNRVDSVRIALNRAGERAFGSVLASDAFFPFADGVEAAIDGGVRAMIQPGGSMRDAESIAACDRAGVPMVFTHRRHFLH